MLLQITNLSVSMISFAHVCTVQWSNMIPRWNVWLLLRIHLTWFHFNSHILIASQLHAAMVNHHISKDHKECALHLQDLGWDKADIIQDLTVSWPSIYCWCSIFEQFGTVKKPPSPPQGCTHIICWAVLTAVYNIYLNKLQLWLAIHHDIVISVSQLQMRLVWARSYLWR